MTEIEQIFYKIVDAIEKTSDTYEIYELCDLRDCEIIGHKEYEKVVQWKKLCDKDVKIRQDMLIQSAKSKLTSEEIEAIKKVGFE